MLMPNSATTQVETLGKRAGKGTLDFADRNGILFKWNNKVNDCHEQLVEEEAVCYPSLTRKFPGIALDCDLPVPSIEDKYEPQGRAEDVAALNANIAPYAIAGVDGLIIINADNDEIEVYDNDNDGIIAVTDIPHNNNMGAHATIDDSDNNIDAEMMATMTAMTTIVTTKKRPSNTSQMTKSAFQECAAQNKRLKEKQQGLPNMA